MTSSNQIEAPEPQSEELESELLNTSVRLGLLVLILLFVNLVF